MRENNLNLLRLLAALAVIVSHSFPVTLGFGAIEPLTNILGYSLGGVAVKVFFAISGLLIYRSWEESSSAQFVLARILRLYPGLIIVSLLLAFVVGPLFTADADYFSQPEPWNYVFETLGLPANPALLPGVFTATPYPGVNGALWTLHYEVACYGGVALAGTLGAFRRFNISLACYAAFFVLCEDTNYAQYSLPFVFGMAIHHYRLPLRLPILTVLAGLTIALYALHNPVAQCASTIAISYGALWFGLLKQPYLAAYNRLGDYSYGVYIYGWPVQQIEVTLFPGLSPYALMASAIPVALACGMLSWHFVEGPMLALRKSIQLPFLKSSHPQRAGDR